MAKNDYELERLRREMDSAQRDIDAAKSRLDAISPKRNAIKSEIEGCKYRIADIKHSIDTEYYYAKTCYQAHDHYGVENHKYRAQSFKSSLEREYSIKNGYHVQLDGIKGQFDSALSALRNAKAKKQQAREAFNRRLQAVKEENAREKAKWKETWCKQCGAKISYHVDWKRVPDLCKSCREREKAKWHEKNCAICGKTIRYNDDWLHVPSICKDCKAEKRSRRNN